MNSNSNSLEDESILEEKSSTKIHTYFHSHLNKKKEELLFRPPSPKTKLPLQNANKTKEIFFYFLEFLNLLNSFLNQSIFQIILTCFFMIQLIISTYEFDNSPINFFIALRVFLGFCFLKEIAERFFRTKNKLRFLLDKLNLLDFIPSLIIFHPNFDKENTNFSYFCYFFLSLSSFRFYRIFPLELKDQSFQIQEFSSFTHKAKIFFIFANAAALISLFSFMAFSLNHMDISFEISQEEARKINIDEAFFLVISTLLTMRFSEGLFPENSFAKLYFHMVFFVFWFYILHISFAIFSKIGISYVSEQKIKGKHVRSLTFVFLMGNREISQFLLKKIDFVKNDHQIFIVKEEKYIKERQYKGKARRKEERFYGNFFWISLDLFEGNWSSSREKDLIQRIKEAETVDFYILGEISKKKLEDNDDLQMNNDIKVVLAASILRNIKKKARICAQIQKEMLLFLDWADWNFVMSRNSIKANLLAKSLLNPGFLVFISTLIKFPFKRTGKSSIPLMFASFTNNSQKLFLNKRFCDVSSFMQLNFGVLLIGLKRPISQKNLLYDLFINPSCLIEDNDEGIFLCSSQEKLEKLWKNESHENPQISYEISQIEQFLRISLDNQKKLPLEENSWFYDADKDDLSFKFSGHFLIKSSFEQFRIMVKALKPLTSESIFFVNDVKIEDSSFFLENKVFYVRCNWENKEEINRLALEKCNGLLLLNENTRDFSFECEIMRNIEYLEEAYPKLNYIAEIACEKSLQFQTINEGFQEKFEIFDDSLFKASKIFCEEILDELLFMTFLKKTADFAEHEVLSKIIIKEMNFHASEIKENNDISSFRISSSFFCDNNANTYGQLFKFFCQEKKVIPFGIFRGEIHKNPNFIVNPEPEIQLIENDIILMFGKVAELNEVKVKSDEKEEFIYIKSRKNSQNMQEKENYEPFIAEKNNIDLLSIAKKVLQENEFLEIKDQEILKKMMKKNQISENHHKKILEQNEILRKLIPKYEAAFLKVQKSL